jgi:myo-inositol-1(or 4)-monophosphatase
MNSYARDLQYAVELARGAGKIIAAQAGRVHRLTKTHAATTDETVTDTDRASQRHIVAGLRNRYPQDGLIGEENDTGDAITFDLPDPNAPPQRVWVIDPIDGTNNFVAGFGAYAVCIGLLERGRPVVGVVYDVARDLMYAAAKGEGAWLGERQLRVVSTGLDDASLLMVTSNLIGPEQKCPPFIVRWLSQTDWKIRILGSAALEVVMVAAGVAHGAVTLNGKLWDIVAPAAIALEAGGVVTDPRGNPIFPYELGGYIGAKVPFLVAAPAAQAELLREIARG